jgi:hypothetical protein
MRGILAAALTVLCLAAPAASGVAAAQDVPVVAAAPSRVTLYEMVLRDGSRVYGAVEREDEIEVVFRTQAGTLVTARRVEIASLRAVTGTIVEGEFLRRDPNGSRLIFGPTGRAVDKGQVYLGVYEFLMPFVQVGVTDRFSIGGGTPLVFGFDDDWERPFWVTPKFQILKRESSSVSAGVMHAFDTDGDGGGIAYGVGTFGSDQGSLTVGAGAAYTGSGVEGAVLMVGGERRLRRNVKWITENYIWSGGNGVTSGGFRFFGERLSADLALAIPIGADDFFVFPVVNFVYVFTGGR